MAEQNARSMSTKQATSCAASFAAQTAALTRKSSLLQYRSWKTSCCLLFSPFVFCMLVFFLQLALNAFILSHPKHQCGCVCLKCCYWADGKAAVPGEDPPCFSGTAKKPPKECTPAVRGDDLTGDCVSYSKKACGIEHSTFKQAGWCGIEHPPTMPIYLQVPEEMYRAEPYTPDTAILYTSGDEAAAQSLTSKFFPESDEDIFRYFSVITEMATDEGFKAGRVGGVSLTLVARVASKQTSSGIPALKDPGIQELLFNSSTLSTEQISTLTEALSVPGVAKIVEDLLLLLGRNGGQIADYNIDGKHLFALAYVAAAGQDYESKQIAILKKVQRVVTHQNTMGSSADAPRLFYVDEAMSREQYLLRNAANTNSCAFPVPPPLNRFPFNYHCLRIHLVRHESLDDMHRKMFCGWQDGRKWLECPQGAPLINAYSTAYNFKTLELSKLDVDIYFNISNFITSSPSLHSMAQPPGRTRRLMESMNLVSSAFLKQALGRDNVSAAIVAVKEMPKLETRLYIDFAAMLGPLLFMLVLQLLLPVMLQQLVYEKSLRLRIMMKMHGLGDAVYWLVTFGWYLLLSVLYLTLLLIFGSAIGLKIFTLNSYGVQITFLLLFSFIQISMAFLLSTLFQSPRTATSFGVVYAIALSFMAAYLMPTLLDHQSPAAIWLELIPAFALYRGLYEMSGYAEYANHVGLVGLTFAKFSDDANGMPEVLAIMTCEFVLFMALAWYLEQALGQVGTRKHWAFCFGAARRRSSSWMYGVVYNDPTRDTGSDANDMQEERARLESMAYSSQQPIVLSELRKVFPPQRGKPSKVACGPLTLALERGECFGLLGPNGAGKTTCINMLVGFLTPSSGTAYIEGNDILKDMDKIYPLMGVCPQHNLLWETMTAREHLLFYGRLKGMNGPALHEEAEVNLKNVNLFNNKIGDKQVRTYSGGMKRRLSVAISMMGNPRVIYMDEPSTGLDPSSRRNLWDIIQQSKEGRAIVLTTHSMEEAEVLCDRMGIIVDGQLQCIGNPKELIARYGGYLVITITTSPADNDKAKAAVLEICPTAKPTYEVAGTQKFEMPTAAISVADVFSGMQRVRNTVEVLDWGVSSASLEDVFIRVATKNGTMAEFL